MKLSSLPFVHNKVSLQEEPAPFKLQFQVLT